MKAAAAGACAEFPYPYRMRRSRRAKRLAVRISRESGLIVVVPWRVSSQAALDFLVAKRTWVDRYQHYLLPKVCDLPDRLDLPGINLSLSVCYQFDEKAKACFIQLADDVLCYHGPHVFSTCRQLLLAWIFRQTQHRLTQQLAALSTQYQLPFNGVRYRRQKTVWGSCTSDKKISLNYKLAFLAPHLVTYVLTHELCHTVHMNHSKHFWALLRRFLPSYQYEVKMLKTGDFLLPDWYFG